MAGTRINFLALVPVFLDLNFFNAAEQGYASPADMSSFCFGTPAESHNLNESHNCMVTWLDLVDILV